MLSLRRFGRAVANLLSIAMVFIALSLGSNGQETEHVDPLATDDLKDWYQASLPVPFGVIAHGSLPFSGKPDEGTSFANPMRAGVMAYYDAWQVAFEMRPEATYIRLMPRTVGRDGFLAAVLEMGFASAKGINVDYYSGTQEEVTVTETRYGGGISAHTGTSEITGMRVLCDVSAGYAERVNLESGFYYNVQLGALLRVPIGAVALSAGPYMELGLGMLTYTSGPQSFDAGQPYSRAGLHIEVALNLNRPQYLTGAE
jgi:hypothetical protein